MNKYAKRAAVTPVIIGALAMVLGGFTESHARGIRTDDPANGGSNAWGMATNAPAASNFQPAGVTGIPAIYEDSSPGDLYDFLPDPPLFAGYTDGFMYNWGTSTVSVQVMLYTGIDDGTQTVCDDAGDLCKSPMGTVTEIDFNDNSGCLGGTLTWGNATYTNHNAPGTSTCDDAFMFVNGALFGAAPPGWSPSSAVPEPATLALFGLGLGLLLMSHRRRRA